MNRIESFEVDHDLLEKGIYISRTDGDIITYDIRMKKPNAEPVMENAAIHTIEHLFATYVRNSEYAESIIYFGPMGCRTGFYFLLRNLPLETAIKITNDAFLFIINFKGEIPGNSKKECGNYLEHDLYGAKKEAQSFYNIIKNL